MVENNLASSFQTRKSAFMKNFLTTQQPLRWDFIEESNLLLLENQKITFNRFKFI